MTHLPLATYTHSKDNNFNLIRLISALAVLVSHGFPIALGPDQLDPIHGLTGMTLGGMAVDVFFVTSGFLVAGSLASRQNSLDFIVARLLRIYPALIPLAIITVLGIGLSFTSLAPLQYLSNPVTTKYLMHCSTILPGCTDQLPGVFEANPMAKAINGSLWTLPYELRMYAILVGTWAILRLTSTHRVRLFNVAMLMFAVISNAILAYRYFQGQEISNFTKLFPMFFTGAAFYVARHQIKLIPALFHMLLALLLISCLDQKAYFYVYHLVLAYLLLYLAYIPTGRIREINRMGDFSYGVYIYAFPIQQSVMHLLPGASVWTGVMLATIPTLALAALSWNLIEKRALALKEPVSTNLRRWISRQPAA